MGKFIDLKGRIYGRLTVIKRNGYYFRKDGRKEILWLCECICGNTTSVLGNGLKTGRTKSCGCYSKEILKRGSAFNLKGKVFGRLVVLRKSEIIDFRRRTFWVCKCKCGKEIEVPTNSLIKGKSKSCGCLQKDIASKKYINIKNKTFGKLTVINKIKTTNKNGVYWNCLCECGNFISASGSRLRKGKISSCGCNRESLVATELKKYFKEKYNSISEYKGCRNKETGAYLFYDIYIKQWKIFIEVNGIQHYKYVSFYHKAKINFKKQLKRDKIKKKFAKKNGTYIEVDLRKKDTIKDIISSIEKIILNVKNK